MAPIHSWQVVLPHSIGRWIPCSTPSQYTTVLLFPEITLAEAQAAGATLLTSATETDWGGYAGYFADLDGYPWEVAWNPYFPLLDDGSVQLPQ